MIRYLPISHVHILRRISHGWSSSESTIYKAHNFELKQGFIRLSPSNWNSTQWGNYPVSCCCTQLITFTVNALLRTSCGISFPRDDGLLSSLQLPNKAHSISISVTMWKFISWINYCLTFPLSQPYFYYSCVPIFQLIKRKEEYSWYLHKGIKSSIPCRILILKPLSLMLSSNWHFCFSPSII